MQPTAVIRSAAGGALSGAARVLGLASRVAEQLSLLVRPPAERQDDTGPGPVGPVATDEVAADLSEQARETSAVADRAGEVRSEAVAPPTEPVPEGPSRVRSPETHIAELAERSADEVVAAVGNLSTDELRRLYEHESANQRRQAVLDAVERAVSTG